MLTLTKLFGIELFLHNWHKGFNKSLYLRQLHNCITYLASSLLLQEADWLQCGILASLYLFVFSATTNCIVRKVPNCEPWQPHLEKHSLPVLGASSIDFEPSQDSGHVSNSCSWPVPHSPGTDQVPCAPGKPCNIRA